MWSLIIQICGMLLVIVSGVLVKSISRAVILAIVVMEGANIVGQGIVAGGGPGMCVGFFLLPLLGVVLVLITFYAANHVKQKGHHGA